MNEFNGIYKPIKEKAQRGANEEDFSREACERCLELRGKPFGWSKCVEVLWAIPKFDPMLVDISGDPEEAAINQVNKVMGSGLPRPDGSKKQKAAAKGKAKVDAASLASLETDKVSSMKEMNKSTHRMAETMECQTETSGCQATIQALVDEAKLFRELGMTDESVSSL